MLNTQTEVNFIRSFIVLYYSQIFKVMFSVSLMNTKKMKGGF